MALAPSATAPGPRACTACDANGATPYAWAGGCVAACPAGMAPDVAGACTPCDAGCSTCTSPANASSCTACPVAGGRPILRGGSCVAACDSGSWSDGRDCRPCDASCTKCSGGGAGACTACPPGARLLGGVCVARPPPAPPADAELAAVSTVVKATASTGKLDIGYEVVGEIKMAKTKVAAAPPTRNATAGYALEKQRLRLVGRADAGAFTGSFSLGFNGEESEALDISLLLGMASGTLNGSVPADAALEVERVLGDLPTVSGGDGTAVSVRALEYNTTLGIDLVTLSFDVHFHAGELVQSPLNLGPLPLLDIFAANLSGVVVAEASVLERGAFSSDPNTNGTFPEQRITFGGTPQQLRDAAPSVFFEVGFGGETAPTTLGLDASATEVREALMGLTTVGELEVFRFDTPTAREYLIRFYAEGDPAHLKVDTLVNVTFVDGGSSGRRHRRELSGVIVIIDEVDSGSSEATDDAEASTTKISLAPTPPATARSPPTTTSRRRLSTSRR